MRARYAEYVYRKDLFKHMNWTELNRTGIRKLQCEKPLCWELNQLIEHYPSYFAAVDRYEK